jgi:hypothetical protein
LITAPTMPCASLQHRSTPITLRQTRPSNQAT